MADPDQYFAILGLRDRDVPQVHDVGLTVAVKNHRTHVSHLRYLCRIQVLDLRQWRLANAGSLREADRRRAMRELEQRSRSLPDSSRMLANSIAHNKTQIPKVARSRTSSVLTRDGERHENGSVGRVVAISRSV
jgi:hypothetical protein